MTEKSDCQCRPISFRQERCALQIVCYNAETFRNNLSHKGLPVIRTRFSAAVQTRLFLWRRCVRRGRSCASRAQPFAHRPTKTTRLRPSRSRPSRKPTTAAKRPHPARARAARAGRPNRQPPFARRIEPRFKLDDAGNVVPDIRAEAAIIYNPENGKVLWESNSTSRRSIASITKVMTAVVFLENSPDLTREVVVERADVRAASTTYLRAGYKLTTGDLLHLLLIGSDNAAARVLARVSPSGLGGIHRADEREGAGARSREHVLCGSLGPARRQRVVRLRPRAS